MAFWKNYKAAVEKNCSSPQGDSNVLAYWGNKLFADIVIHLLPFCLIPFLPGIYYCILYHLYVLASIEILIIASMLLIAFVPGIRLNIRKIIFISSMYILSCCLLYYIGQYGPGLMYLFATCIFCILIYPSSNAYLPAWANVIVCIFFAAVIQFNLFKWHKSAEHWLLISANLVFLSFLSAALIPRLFKGLQTAIDKEKHLNDEIKTQHQSLKKASDMLKKKNEELEQFAYVASHDLQEPLRMVSSFLSQLEKKYGHIIDEKGKKYIHFAVDGAKRMRQIILDLLEYSRVGQTEHNKEKIDLKEIINEIEVLFRKQIEEKKATIKTENLPVIINYKAPIQQIFQNLVGNGLKYTPKGRASRIHIRARELSDCWEFVISDNGIGISQEHHARIFAIFQRLHTKDEYPGTGIGLAVTKKIIEGQGGKIWVESKPDEGSNFYFTILKKQL